MRMLPIILLLVLATGLSLITWQALTILRPPERPIEMASQNSNNSIQDLGDWVMSSSGGTWALVIVGLFTAFFALQTLGTLNTQTATQINTLRIAERPNVFLSDVQLLTTNFDLGERIVVSAQFTNSGRQPTTDLEITMGLKYLRATDPGGDIIAGAEISSLTTTQGLVTIAPQATLEIPFARGELIGDLPNETAPGDPRYNNAWRLYVYGSIRYTLPLENDRAVTEYFAARCFAWEQQTRPDDLEFQIHNVPDLVNMAFP